MFTRKIKLLFIFPLFIACQDTGEEREKYVDSPYISISNSAIDYMTRQDIYDNLYEIYQCRKEAIEGKIRTLLLSQRKGTSYLSIDSIIKRHNIRINLKEPTSPLIPIKEKYIHWNGNLDSQTSIIGFVNPECDLCHIVVRRINELFKSLKDKTKNGYVIYSNENTLSIQALLYASQKNKFTELFDDFISSAIPLDTSSILKKMAMHNLDTTDFHRNLSELQEKCLEQNIYLREQGISKTPTILVNNKLIYNPLDTTKIKKNLFTEK